MMLTVTHQKPATLDPVHTIPCVGDYDPITAIEHVIAKPLLEPLHPQQPVTVVDDKKNDQTANLTDIVMTCLGENINPAAEDTVKDLLAQTLIHFDRSTPLPVNELFVVQAGQACKLPAPAHNVIYTAAHDVLPSAKSLLGGASNSDLFFASLSYTFHPETLGFWFQSSSDFDEFKAWLDAQIQAMAAVLPGDTVTLLAEFNKLKLNQLTESLLLRENDSDGNEELSFARVLVSMLMSYVGQQNGSSSSATGGNPLVGVLPFVVTELFCPRSLVLVNVEAHARATASRINGEWKLINQSLASPVKVVSNKHLSKLTSLARAATKAAAASNNMPGQPGSRSAQVKFRKQPPNKLDLFNDIKRVLRRMGQVNRSQNIFRASKSTFLKANRRNPDDFNKPGRITSVKYMPDLHVYVDTSGSISERNYQDAMMLLIALAKKMNVNLFFNSFSDIMSQEVMLRTENKSQAQIWKEFRRIPKVTGGTEYAQIWQYINSSKVRRRQLSLMITDFEWWPPNRRLDHPPNLFYAPCGSMNWNYLVDSAKSFADSMKHIDPTIRQKMLGMNL